MSQTMNIIYTHIYMYMLCYVMLCYVMLCCVMLCYVMLSYVMLCYVVLCYVILCYVFFDILHIYDTSLLYVLHKTYSFAYIDMLFFLYDIL